MSNQETVNRNKKMRNKKLLLQVGLIVCAIFLVIMLVTGTLVYSGSKSLYLQAKNELIERDLDRVKGDFEKVHMLSWTLDYCEAHPKELEGAFENIIEIAQDYSEIAIDFYNKHGVDDLSKPVNDPKIAEALNKADAKTQLAVAYYNYETLIVSFYVLQYSAHYDRAYCIDIRKENRGFTYCATDPEDPEEFTIGEKWDYPISSHPAISTLLNGENEEDVVFEVAKIDKHDQDYYIGYIPMELDGEIKCTICISFDFSAFREGFMPYIIYMFIIGFAVMLLSAGILLLFLRRSATRPLSMIQQSVRTYINDKDSAAIAAAMDTIHSQNEFGVLSEDITALAEEIDRYTKENITLASEREKVQAELGLAAKIQSDMLPKTFPEMPQFELFASMDPAKEVGGDFYDFFMIDEDHLGMVIADVSGKGVPASLYMMMSMIVIRNYARAGKSPAEVLRKSNRSICENNDEIDSMFVTVWFGVLELSTGHVIASNAGHEYPMLRKANSDFELFKDKHGFVLGGMPGVKYKEYEFDIEKGGTLFLYTDGAPEATDIDNQLFGTDRMLSALNEAPDSSPEELIAAMTAAIDGFVGDAPQFDDTTMLCVKYKGPDQPKTE